VSNKEKKKEEKYRGGGQDIHGTITNSEISKIDSLIPLRVSLK
jgi:hypothetical protein